MFKDKETTINKEYSLSNENEENIIETKSQSDLKTPEISQNSLIENDKGIDKIIQDANFDSIFIKIYALFQASIDISYKRYIDGFENKHENEVKKAEEIVKNMTKEEKIEMIKKYIVFFLSNN